MPPSEIGASAVDAIARIPTVSTILDVVCQATGMRFAAVARVTETSWIACTVRDALGFGLEPGGELEISTTFCDVIRRSGEPIVIDEVAIDAVYAGHPVPRQYGFQSYISVPIPQAGGQIFGTLCALDPLPAKVNRPEIIGMFTLFAELIGTHLDTQDRLAHSDAALRQERRAKQLQEQFIAVLGHDLRGPLAALTSSVRLLRDPSPEIAPGQLLGAMETSLRRMDELISHILDLARERLGSGLRLVREDGVTLQPVLEDVIAEQRLATPDRLIETRFDMSGAAMADRARIGQLFANLLSNAVKYSPAGSAVCVSGISADGVFELAVANRGTPIPQETIALLFEPFYRAPDRTDREGLGLGLYVAAAVARGHGGTLSVTSDETETRFTFRMPLARA